MWLGYRTQRGIIMYRELQLTGDEKWESEAEIRVRVTDT